MTAMDYSKQCLWAGRCKVSSGDPHLFLEEGVHRLERGEVFSNPVPSVPVVDIRCTFPPSMVGAFVPAGVYQFQMYIQRAASGASCSLTPSLVWEDFVDTETGSAVVLTANGTRTLVQLPVTLTDHTILAVSYFTFSLPASGVLDDGWVFDLNAPESDANVFGVPTGSSGGWARRKPILLVTAPAQRSHADPASLSGRPTFKAQADGLYPNDTLTITKYSDTMRGVASVLSNARAQITNARVIDLSDLPAMETHNRRTIQIPVTEVRAASTAYGVDDQIVQSGYIFRPTVAGTTGAGAFPSGPYTIGSTYTDGGVTWRCEATAGAAPIAPPDPFRDTQPTAVIWSPWTDYAAGSLVVPPGDHEHAYRTTAGGRSRFLPDNEFLSPFNFGISPWASLNATITRDVAANPVNGRKDADLIVDTATSGLHYVRQVFPTTVTGSYWVYAVYLKNAGRRYARLYMDPGASPAATFDLQDGVLTEQAGGTVWATIQDQGNGWYRCAICMASTGVENRAYVLLHSTGTAGSSSYAGTGVGVYLWGAMVYRTLDPDEPLRELAFPELAWPTDGSTVRDSLNLVDNSEALDAATWAKARTTITPNWAINPVSGRLTGDAIWEDGTATSTHYVGAAAAAVKPGTAYTLSGHFFERQRRYVYLQAIDDDGGAPYAIFDLATGTVASAVGCTAEVFTDPAWTVLWRRCTIHFTTGAAASQVTPIAYLADGSLASTYSGIYRANTAQAGGDATHIKLDAGASATDGFYVGGLIQITAGSGVGEYKTITGYVGATKIATVSSAWSSVPDATSTFTINAGVYAWGLQLNEGGQQDYERTETQAVWEDLGERYEYGSNTCYHLEAKNAAGTVISNTTRVYTTLDVNSPRLLDTSIDPPTLTSPSGCDTDHDVILAWQDPATWTDPMPLGYEAEWTDAEGNTFRRIVGTRNRLNIGRTGAGTLTWTARSLDPWGGVSTWQTAGSVTVAQGNRPATASLVPNPIVYRQPETRWIYNDPERDIETAYQLLICSEPFVEYDELVMASNPSAYWKLGEPLGAVNALDAKGKFDLTAFGSPTFGTAALLVGDDDTCCQFDGVNDYLKSATPLWQTFPAGFTVEWVMNPSAASDANYRCLLDTYKDANNYLTVQVGNNASRYIYARFRNGGAALGKVWENKYANGAAQHCKVTYDGANWKLYIDDVDQGAPVDSPGAPAVTTVGTSVGAWPTGVYPAPMVLSALAVYPRALSVAENTAHDRAAKRTWVEWASGAGVSNPTVTSAATAYQHAGLSLGRKYRALRVQTRGTDWSPWTSDWTLYAAKTSQAEEILLYRKNPDGILSRIWTPVTSPKLTRAYGESSGFSFTINNYHSRVETSLHSCHNFDEQMTTLPSGPGEYAQFQPFIAHDIFGGHDLEFSVGSPVWAGSYLSLPGGAYGISQDLSDFTLDHRWETYLALKATGTTGCLWCIAAGANNTNYFSVRYNGSGKVRIVVNGANSADLTVSTTGWTLLRLSNDMTTLTLTNAMTGVSVTLASVHPTGTPRLGIGAFVGLTIGSIVDAGLIAGHMLYSSTLGTADRTRNRDGYYYGLQHRGIQL